MGFLKAGAYFAAVLFLGGISIWAGIRSRLRLRALMRDTPASPQPCTISRPAAAAWLQDTRMLRGLIEGMLADLRSRFRDEEATEKLNSDLIAYLRSVGEWRESFSQRMAPEDRAALEQRGVMETMVSSLGEFPEGRGPHNRITLALTQHDRELAQIEARMTEVPKVSVYR